MGHEGAQMCAFYFQQNAKSWKDNDTQLTHVHTTCFVTYYFVEWLLRNQRSSVN